MPKTGTADETRSAIQFVSPRSPDPLHRLREGADPGQDHPVGAPGALVVVGHLGVDAN